MSRVRRLAAVLVLAMMAAPGCGYSLAGRGSFLPDYIRTIGVPQFVNGTPIYDVDRRVSERIRGELAGRGKYRIDSTATGVDAVLSGVITSLTVSPTSFNQQQTASRYVLVLTAAVEFKDVKTGKVMWSNPAMSFREEFDVTNTTEITDASVYLNSDANALDRIANEFARSLISALLEAF